MPPSIADSIRRVTGYSSVPYMLAPNLRTEKIISRPSTSITRNGAPVRAPRRSKVASWRYWVQRADASWRSVTAGSASDAPTATTPGSAASASASAGLALRRRRMTMPSRSARNRPNAAHSSSAVTPSHRARLPSSSPVSAGSCWLYWALDQ